MSKSAQTLRIRDADDLLGVVPHLLGFHPSESLVIVLAEKGRVVVTARVNLSDVAPPGAVEDLLRRMFAQFPDGRAWLIAYGADAAATWAVLNRCDRFLPAQAIAGVLRVDGGRWWADSPDAPPGVHAPSASPLSRLARERGLPVCSSRAGLAKLVAPDPDVDPVLFARAEAWLAATACGRAELMRQALSGRGGDADDVACARLAVLAGDEDARDEALLAIDVADPAADVALWRRVARRCLPSYQGHVLGLLGMAAWIAGDGALSVVCLERAESINPGLPLVEVLSTINELMLPPRAWPGLRREVISARGEPVGAVRAGAGHGKRQGERRKEKAVGARRGRAGRAVTAHGAPAAG